MTAPRPRPVKAPRPAPPVRQQGAWGNNHHNKRARHDAAGNRVRGRARVAAWGKRLRDRAEAVAAARARWKAGRAGMTTKAAPKPASTAPRGRTAQLRSSGSMRKARRRIGRPRKRGTIYALFTVVIGAAAVTAVVLELTSLAVATELAFTADSLGALAAWWVGEPSDRGPITQKRTPAGNGSKPAPSGGCSPACMYGNPAKAKDCKCSCGGATHGSKSKKAGKGAPGQTSTPKPRTRKPRAKPTTTGPATSTPKPRARKASAPTPGGFP
jgi:hypothetical protein